MGYVDAILPSGYQSLKILLRQGLVAALAGPGRATASRMARRSKRFTQSMFPLGLKDPPGQR
jgi:hypothetical protein